MDDFNSTFQAAVAHASRFGMGLEAEDFAQEYFLQVVEGRQITIEEYFKEFRRQHRADKGFLGSSSGQFGAGRTVSIDDKVGKDEDSPTYADRIGFFRDDVECESEVRSIFGVIDLVLGLVSDEGVRAWARNVYELFLEDNV